MPLSIQRSNAKHCRAQGTITEVEYVGRARPFSESDYKTGLAERYGGEPLSIQVRKRSTCSAGQGPSQGMLPAASFS